MKTPVSCPFPRVVQALCEKGFAILLRFLVEVVRLSLPEPRIFLVERLTSNYLVPQDRIMLCIIVARSENEIDARHEVTALCARFSYHKFAKGVVTMTAGHRKSD